VVYALMGEVWRFRRKRHTWFNLDQSFPYLSNLTTAFKGLLRRQSFGLQDNQGFDLIQAVLAQETLNCQSQHVPGVDGPAGGG